MSSVPAKVTYLVSKQSNRNLVLNSGVARRNPERGPDSGRKGDPDHRATAFRP